MGNREKNGLKNMPDYSCYRYRWQDWLQYGIGLLMKGMIICYLFYDSYQAVFLLFPFAFVDYQNLKKAKLKEQKRQLVMQFKSMMNALVASLNAGYSLESAFSGVKKDLEPVYEKKAAIFEEIDGILAGLKVNIPLEKLLKDFGSRSGIEDIRNFANVVTAAKRSGGNLIHIMQKTMNSISDKLAVEEEIETLITGKKLEERIMMVMPYGIMFYLRWSNKEFFEVLYHNALGVMIMTAFLIVIYIADVWAGKIMEIEV